jgi:membrane fusion protein (multidrug efflux system)
LASVLLATVASLTACTPNAEGKPGEQDQAAQGDLVQRAKAALCAVVRVCAQAPAREPRRRGEPIHLVELSEVQTGTLRLTSVYTGSLRSRLSVRVFNQEEGQVKRLPFYEGDRVADGEVVLELDATLLRALLDKSVAVRKDAETSLRRVTQLGRGNLISQDEISRAATAVEVARAEERVLRIRLGYTAVRAPFTGVVSARLVEVGDIVPRHSHVMTLNDPSSLVTELTVSELLIPHLDVDDPVTVRIDALGDRAFPGRVLRIHPTLDPLTRQGLVEIELRPVPTGARAGQFARVAFATEALGRKHLPFAALRRDRDGEYVFRVGEGRRAERVAVRSGRRLADRVEILEGLEAGDRVVIKGFLGLGDGQVVEPVDGAAAAPADNASRTGGTSGTGGEAAAGQAG